MKDIKDIRVLPDKAIIGMIHLLALPRTPFYDEKGGTGAILDQALNELRIYQEEGVDAVMLENMHDVPYQKPPLAPDTLDAFYNIAQAVRRAAPKLPIGIQVLEGANVDAITMAAMADLDFIRAEGFVYAHVGGSGLIDASARDILMKRSNLGAGHIRVFADVKKKHCAHALTADLSIADIARQSEFFCADGIIVTGGFTGDPVKRHDLNEVSNVTDLPILIGSGITDKNLDHYFDLATGFIVGTHFKFNGRWQNLLNPRRIGELIHVRNRLLHGLVPSA